MTSRSRFSAQRRFFAMLWLSLALHAVVIGLTRLPPPVKVPQRPEIEVRIARTAQPVPPAPPDAPHKPGPKPVARLAKMEPSVPQPAPAPPAPAVAPASPQPVPVSVQSASLTAPDRAPPGPEVNIPLLADERYYTAKQLDLQPSPLRRPEPVYPFQAEEQGVAGRVLVRLHLESDGSVSRTEVVSVAPSGVFGEMFRKATLDAVRGIGFRPAQRNGQPVRAVVEIPVVFEPER
jgi:protein TonB